MKTNYILSFVLSLALFFATSCGTDETETTPKPDNTEAAFTYTVDSENPNKYSFSANPNVDFWFSHWSFGDQTGAEGLEASKIFYEKGTYKVRFKIFTEGGTAEQTQEIVIENDYEGVNLVNNGKLDNADDWQIINIAGGVELLIENGQATWTGGGWGNQALTQLIEFKAGVEYEVDMEISGGPLTESWFEVYINEKAPTEGNDYSEGGIMIGLNTWDGCGGEPFDALLSSISCSNGARGNSFIYDNNTTAYLTIKGGGASLGDNGIAIDNITIRPKE
ncbi:MAG: PKD domain-containing protein [Bacteroidia bacterium]